MNMATFDGLFDPAKVAEKRRLDSEKREALARIKAWAEELLPELTLSRAESAEPERARPKAEGELPGRQTDLRDVALPGCRPSRTDKPEPSAARP